MIARTGFEPDNSSRTYLSDISPKDKSWDKHRSQADKVRDLYEGTDYNSYAERIARCSDTLVFEWIVNKETLEPNLKLCLCRFCRCRHCPVCASRKQLMWRGRFFEALPKILNDYPKARFIFLTLTVKNCHVTDLKDTVTLMNQAWKRLIERKQFPALGYFRSTEVTREYECTGSICPLNTVKSACKDCTPTQYAHPHFHAILMVNPGYFSTGYVSHAKWLQMWKESLRVEYDPSVNVKVIKSDDSQPDKVGYELMKGVCEVLKYSIKPEELVSDREWLLEITKQLYKTRSVAVGGIFRKYISDKEPENLINDDKDEDNGHGAKISFGWREAVARYLKIDLVV